MGGPIVRTGTTPKFWEGYDRIFGASSKKSGSTKKEAAKSEAKPAKKKSAAKKSVGKKKK